MKVEHGYDKECPKCGSEQLITDYQQSQVVCGDCGYTLADHLKTLDPDWRRIDEMKDSDRRAGPPIDRMRFDKGLTTQIQKRSKDGKGKSMDAEQKRKSWKLRMTEKRTRLKDSHERGIAFASSEIQRLSSGLNLPERAEVRSLDLYREASKEGLVRGRSREGIATASIYATCRILDIPRTMEEIARTSAIDRKELRRSFLSLSRNLDLDIPPADPADYISKYSDELDMSTESRRLARKILRRAKNEGLVTGRNPRGVVGAILYLAAKKNGESRTQKRTAETVKVTAVTLRNRFRELEEEIDLTE